MKQKTTFAGSNPFEKSKEFTSTRPSMKFGMTEDQRNEVTKERNRIFLESILRTIRRRVTCHLFEITKTVSIDSRTIMKLIEPLIESGVIIEDKTETTTYYSMAEWIKE